LQEYQLGYCAALEESTSQHYEDFRAKNCIIAKYPFYLAIENTKEQDYSTEKLWDAFKLGVVPIIYLIVALTYRTLNRDYPNVEDLANHLKYLVENKTAYLEYYQWRTTKTWSEEFKKKAYINLHNMKCNICKEVSRLRIIEGR
ncbi:2758_t:CDS:2, partial [Racocetra persica]